MAGLPLCLLAGRGGLLDGLVDAGGHFVFLEGGVCALLKGFGGVVAVHNCRWGADEMLLVVKLVREDGRCMGEVEYNCCICYRW